MILVEVQEIEMILVIEIVVKEEIEGEIVVEVSKDDVMKVLLHPIAELRRRSVEP